MRKGFSKPNSDHMKNCDIRDMFKNLSKVNPSKGIQTKKSTLLNPSEGGEKSGLGPTIDFESSGRKEEKSGVWLGIKHPPPPHPVQHG